MRLTNELSTKKKLIDRTQYKVENIKDQLAGIKTSGLDEETADRLEETCRKKVLSLAGTMGALMRQASVIEKKRNAVEKDLENSGLRRNSAGQYATPQVPAEEGPADQEESPLKKRKVEKPKVEKPKAEFRQGTLFKFGVRCKNSDSPKKMEVVLDDGHPCMCKKTSEILDIPAETLEQAIWMGLFTILTGQK